MMPACDRELVRQVVREVVTAREPERLEELEVCFDDAYDAATGELAGSPASVPGEGLPIDLSFFTGSLVTSAVWATVLLIQNRAVAGGALRRQLDETTGDPALVAEIERRIQALVVVREPAPLRSAAADLRISVAWQRGTHEELIFRADGAERLGEPMGRRVLNRPLAEFFGRRLAETERLALRDRGDSEAMVLNRGAALFEQLLSEPLQALLWEVGVGSDVQSLLFLSEEGVIPWELLAFPQRRDKPVLSGRALCDRFVVCRWAGGREPAPQVARGPLAILRTGESGLPRLESECGQVRSSWGERSSEEPVVRYQPVIEALKADRFAAFHFAGHGKGPGTSAESPELFLEDESLTPDDLAALPVWQHTRPLVFLNACQTAQGGWGLTGAEGWARAFLGLGAGALVAPCWSLADSRATAFAACFYERLTGGDTLGQATRAAREHLREEFPGDPSWLAYALWGDPGARLEGSAAEPPPLPGSDEVLDLDALPSRSWNNKREYKLLAGSLAEAGSGFEPTVFAFLQLALAELGTGEAEPRKLAEGLTLFGDGSPYPLVLQCEVLMAPPDGLGDQHVEQCRRAVDRFRRLPVTAGLYVLVHNHDRRDRRFHERLEALLAGMVAEGRVARAEVVDHQRLLTRSFDAMRARFLRLVDRRGLSLRPVEASLSALGGRPVEQVPLRKSWLKIDQHALQEETGIEEAFGDPAAAALESAGRDPVLLLGDFGFGKTTALARALVESEPKLRLFYVPAAALDREIKGAKDLQVRAVDLEGLLAGLPDSQRADLLRLARPVIEYAFKGHDLSSALVFDGLDEAPFLARAGGLQWLFNCLWEVQVPVVLAMRSEFWERRRGEFGTAFGDRGRKTSARVQTVRRLDLMAWGTPQILEYVARFRRGVDDECALAHLDRFERAARDGELERLYGDLLGTPLLLTFAVEAVAAEGMPRERVGRASLVLRGIEMKVRRDLAAPAELGGGRALLAPGGSLTSVEDVLELSWHAMLCAAVCMVEREEAGEVALLPDCPESRLAASSRRLAEVSDWLDVTLVSLLRTVSRPSFREPRRIAFSHRAFQEFFLAWYLELTGQSGSLTVPETVREWIADLRREGLPGAGERRAAFLLPPLPDAAPAS